MNEELKEFNKDVLGKPDAPLVVHKKSDASYGENTNQYEMNETHTGEERPTLKRHRFRKENKKSKAPMVMLVLLVIAVAVFAGLYFTGNITFGERETTTVPTTVPTTTDIVASYEGTIVVKDTYIFVNGEEVNGIEGLQKELKYEDASPTAFEIIVEDENTDFFNMEVLALLEDMGFFDKTTQVTHLDKTGLIAAEETTKAKKKTKKKKAAATTVEATAPATTAAE